MAAEDKKSAKFNPLFGLEDRYTAIVLVIFFVIMMIPIIYLGKYNFMKADDFSYGDEAHVAFARTGSVIEALKGALVSVKSGYQKDYVSDLRTRTESNDEYADSEYNNETVLIFLRKRGINVWRTICCTH